MAPTQPLTRAKPALPPMMALAQQGEQLLGFCFAD
jgi:hypothetical protein